MKIYVAARFHEKERVKTIYQKLQEMGHTITTDWTVCQTKLPYSQHQEWAKNCALHTIKGVKDCEVFIFLTNAEIGAGSSTELGAALLSYTMIRSPRIYVVGEHIDKNFCYFHPAVIMKDNIEEVFEELNPEYPSYLDTNNYGKCLRADRDLEAGVIIATADLERTDKPYIANNSEHIHIALMDVDEKGNPSWGKVRGKWAFCNHSCDPNCDITDEWKIVTNRPVKKGQELTTSYDAFVYNFPWPKTWDFECKCESVNCKKIINQYRTDIVYPIRPKNKSIFGR